MSVRVYLTTFAALAVAVAAGSLAWTGDASASRTYSYDTPVLDTSPWPAMRRDRRNTASSPIRARLDRNARPWRFRTGKGVFSTPIIDGRDTAYFGSADRIFYAVDRKGELEIDRLFGPERAVIIEDRDTVGLGHEVRSCLGCHALHERHDRRFRRPFVP